MALSLQRKKSGRNQLNFALRKVITITSLFELVEN
jgi:hypothetical protein